MAPTSATTRTVRTAAATIWVALILAAHLYGDHLTSMGVRLFADFPPLLAQPSLHLQPQILFAAVLAFGVVWWGPSVASRLGWRSLLVVSALAAGLFAVALAASDGWDAIIAPLTSNHEYLSNVSRVTDPGVFLSEFTQRISTYTVHVQGHPPGMVLLLWAMSKAGLGGPWPAAWLMIATGASAVAAVLVTVREIVTEKAAQTVAPYVVLIPAVIWLATSADAFYMGLGAWGIALFALATGRTTNVAIVIAAASGLLLGLLLFFSYGAVPLGIFVLVLAASRRSIGQLLATTAAVAVVAGAFAVGGFWWFDGLQATLVQYRTGAGGIRPQSYFAWANLATFAVATGPAVAAGLSGLRDRRAWLLVGSSCVAVLASTTSGFSKAEVERIWLGFAIWMPVACLSLPTKKSTARFWLGAQALLAVALQIGLRTPW